MADLPKSVTILDETMREGLQIEDKDIPVSEKLRLLDALGETGARVINIGSFGSPKWCPQMANIDELAERFVPKPGVTYTAATYNAKGVERAKKYHPKLQLSHAKFRTRCDLSETFNMRNFNLTGEEERSRWPGAIRKAQETGQKEGQVNVGSPFGCNFEGEAPLERALQAMADQIELWHEAGIPVTTVTFADATGWNLPHRVRRLLEAVRERWPEIKDIGCHFHNTRGMAIASYYEALQLGATRFWTCLGGMGGCPYCGNGRAAGLPPTEDLVFMCEEMGIETGYKLDKLIEAAAIAEEVVGHPLYGHVSKAGPLPRGERLYAKDLPFVETLEEAQHYRKGAAVCAHQIAPWKEYPESKIAKALAAG
jgi:hydroxymethylglutaryl-CoA lyase